MRLLPRLTALLLLAFWLPATEHCALEAAGVIATLCHDDGGAAAQSCADDGCATLESAHYRVTLHLVQAAPPVLQDHVAALALALASPTLALALEAAPPTPGRPVDWVPVWHFVRRTAPPSRAPTSRLA